VIRSSEAERTAIDDDARASDVGNRPVAVPVTQTGRCIRDAGKRVREAGKAMTGIGGPVRHSGDPVRQSGVPECAPDQHRRHAGWYNFPLGGPNLKASMRESGTSSPISETRAPISQSQRPTAETHRPAGDT
jgi:hypothetical protein